MNLAAQARRQPPAAATARGPPRLRGTVLGRSASAAAAAASPSDDTAPRSPPPAALKQRAADAGPEDGVKARRRSPSAQQSPPPHLAALRQLTAELTREQDGGGDNDPHPLPSLPLVRSLLQQAGAPVAAETARRRRSNPRERAEALALAAALPRRLTRAGVADARLVVSASAAAFSRALGVGGGAAAAPQKEEGQEQQQQPPLAALAARWPAADHPLVGLACAEFFEGVREAAAVQNHRRRQQETTTGGSHGAADLPKLIAAATSAAREPTGSSASTPAPLTPSYAALAAAGAGVVAAASGALPSSVSAARFLRALAALQPSAAEVEDGGHASAVAEIQRAALEAARLLLLADPASSSPWAAAAAGALPSSSASSSLGKRSRWRWASRQASQIFGGPEEARLALELAGIALPEPATEEGQAAPSVPLLLEAAAALSPAAAASAAAAAAALAAAAHRRRLVEQQSDDAWGVGGGYDVEANGASAATSPLPPPPPPVPEAPASAAPLWGAALRVAALRSSLSPLDALRGLEALAQLRWNPGATFLDGVLLPALASGFGGGDSTTLTASFLTAAHTVRALRALAGLGHQPTDEWWLACQSAPVQGLDAAVRAAAASGAQAAALPSSSSSYASLAARAGAASATLEAVGAAASAAARLRLPACRATWARDLLGLAAAAAARSRRVAASMPQPPDSRRRGSSGWSALDALTPLELSRLMTGIAWLERSYGLAEAEEEDSSSSSSSSCSSLWATPPGLLRSLLRYCAARGRQVGKHATNAVRALVVLQELTSVRRRSEQDADAQLEEAARLLSPDSPELLAARRGLVVETHWALPSMSPEGLAVLLNGAAALSPGRPLGGGAAAGVERWAEAALATVERRAAQCPVLPGLDGGGGDGAGGGADQGAATTPTPTTTPRQLALSAAGLARLGVRPPDAVLRRVLDAAAVRPFGGATLEVLREALDALLEGELPGEPEDVEEDGAAVVAAAALAAAEDDDDAFAAFVDVQLSRVRAEKGDRDDD
jgi:hypothetical protein